VIELGGKRILVTGGRGFLGSHLVERLEARGAEVLAPGRADYDLVEVEPVRAMYRELAPEIVFHLAAEVGGIGANRANPGRYFFANAQMGIAVIDEARRAGVEKIVVAGTVCAYPKHAAIPFREDALWDGYPEETNAPYGLAKKMLLVQCQAYRDQYGTNAIMLFPVNLYGPRDNFDLETSHVIPALIRRCLEACERGADHITLWGDGSPTREFLHVDDAARGLVLAGERYDNAEPVNLGTGVEITIGDLARKIAALCEFDGELRWDTSRPNGQPRRCLDVSRARERFGFVAEVDLDDGLARTVEWYRRARRGSDKL
jgi:GDP-L-fucose synthase